MVKSMKTPRLYELVATVGFDSREATFDAVRLAVVTVTPEVSVAVSVPTPVTNEPLLKNVPADVPALTVKMKVLVDVPGTVVPPGKVQLIVPLAPTLGVVEGAPIVPEPVLT